MVPPAPAGRSPGRNEAHPTRFRNGPDATAAQAWGKPGIEQRGCGGESDCYSTQPVAALILVRNIGTVSSGSYWSRDCHHPRDAYDLAERPTGPRDPLFVRPF